MANVYVQFSDASKQTVTAVFGCAQSTEIYPNQGMLNDTDARYLAFINASPWKDLMSS